MPEGLLWPDKIREGSIINTEERRRYFQNFTCGVLTADLQNRELIKKFVSKKANNQLESYIKDDDKAWAEDSDGETRVYVVKDENGKIALFFSIKCGLLIGENPKYKLNPAEREFVEIIYEAMVNDDQSALEGYYAYGTSEFGERIDTLFEVANKRLNIKKESKKTGQVETWRVEKCVSAIELRHLCKNEQYSVPENLGVPFGFGIFWEKIVPELIGITKKVGCKYIYLFAADKSEELGDGNIKSLVNYYKNDFKFYECEDDDLVIVKPDYDEDCYGLIQEVSMLESNREAVWHEFSDV